MPTSDIDAESQRGHNSPTSVLYTDLCSKIGIGITELILIPSSWKVTSDRLYIHTVCYRCIQRIIIRLIYMEYIPYLVHVSYQVYRERYIYTWYILHLCSHGPLASPHFFLKDKGA